MNIIKKIAWIAVFATVICCLCGCPSSGGETTGNTESETGTYSVSIVDQNGAPVPSVVLQFDFKTLSSQLAITGADGTASATADEAAVSVTLNSLPTGYTSEKTVYEMSGKELTIVLTGTSGSENNGVTYTVTVVDQNGDPVEGVLVQLCDDESCKLPMATDANGVASGEYPESNYHVTLNTIPDGYSSDVTEFYFDSGKTEMTVTVTKNGE